MKKSRSCVKTIDATRECRKYPESIEYMRKTGRTSTDTGDDEWRMISLSMIISVTFRQATCIYLPDVVDTVVLNFGIVRRNIQSD